MSDRLVQNIPYNSELTTEFAPAVGDDRYKSSPLTDLGPSFMTWTEEGETDQWTVGYEEVLYVIEGRLTVIGVQDGEEYTTVGEPGDVITVGKGASVRYGGSKGTRAFVCFTPLNWQDLIK